jgi:hypothetical protein
VVVSKQRGYEDFARDAWVKLRRSCSSLASPRHRFMVSSIAAQLVVWRSGYASDPWNQKHDTASECNNKLGFAEKIFQLHLISRQDSEIEVTLSNRFNDLDLRQNTVRREKFLLPQNPWASHWAISSGKAIASTTARHGQTESEESAYLAYLAQVGIAEKSTNHNRWTSTYRWKITKIHGNNVLSWVVQQERRQNKNDQRCRAIQM